MKQKVLATLLNFLPATAAVLLGACAGTPVPADGLPPAGSLPVADTLPAHTTVHFDGSWIVYRGDVSPEANKQARLLFSAHPDAAGLKITSNGGSVADGMALGEWLLVTGRDVYIDGYCFSSCANYVFPAGRRKVVANDAIIGWHGGTRQWADAEAMCAGVERVNTEPKLAQCIEHAHATRDREARFYSLLGVDPDIMVFGLRPGANYPAQVSDMAWTYSAEDLARFGIRNFDVDGEEWVPVLEIDGQTVCLMDVAKGRCESVPQRR